MLVSSEATSTFFVSMGDHLDLKIAHLTIRSADVNQAARIATLDDRLRKLEGTVGTQSLSTPGWIDVHPYWMKP